MRQRQDHLKAVRQPEPVGDGRPSRGLKDELEAGGHGRPRQRLQVPHHAGVDVGLGGSQDAHDRACQQLQQRGVRRPLFHLAVQHVEDGSEQPDEDAGAVVRQAAAVGELLEPTHADEQVALLLQRQVGQRVLPRDPPADDDHDGRDDVEVLALVDQVQHGLQNLTHSASTDRGTW